MDLFSYVNRIADSVYLGSKFSLSLLKAILYYLLLNFSFEVNKDTQIPLILMNGPSMTSEKGVHLELRPRTKRKYPKFTNTISWL